MEIVNSVMEDIDKIFALYDEATAYQKTVFNKQWEGFERELVITEIRENRQWKICIEGNIACIFVINFDDELFWREKAKQPAIYIHRIVTNPKYRGATFMHTIIEWAKQFCKDNAKDFIRIDTWGDNQKLIDYYVRCGFQHLETINVDKIDGLPAHYKGVLALLEIKI